MPVNTATVGPFSPSVLMTPPFSLSIGPYLSYLPTETHFPIRQGVGAEVGSMVPEHLNSQDSSRCIHDSQVERVQETRVCEQQSAHDRADGRWSPDRLDDPSYRDKILDDDISRERLEKRLMKAKIEQWRIRDGVDSDRVEFERLRTPHRNVIDDGMFSAFLCPYCFYWFAEYSHSAVAHPGGQSGHAPIQSDSLAIKFEFDVRP